jgi:hypothetical protein
MDLTRIQGAEISGLSSEELDFLTEYVHTLPTTTVINQWTGMPSGISIPSPTDIEHINLDDFLLDMESPTSNCEY